MLRTYTTAALFTAATLMGSATFAATDVKEVNVDVDLTAIQDPTAASYWTAVAGDLETAIVARITSQIADEGALVRVDIDELSLANTFQSIMGLSSSELKGLVTVEDRTDDADEGEYTLTVTVEPAEVDIPVGSDATVIRSTTEQKYMTIIDAFADRVVANLQ